MRRKDCKIQINFSYNPKKLREKKNNNSQNKINLNSNESISRVKSRKVGERRNS